MAGLGDLVTIADANRQQPIQAAGHQRQLQVAVDLHGHRRGQRIHVEEIDPVLDVVLDQHPLGVTTDEVGSRPAELVRQQQGRFLMPQLGDGQLTERAVVAVQRYLAIQNAGVLYARETLSSSIRRQADAGARAISATSFFDRLRSVMNRIPIWFSSLRLA